MAKNINLILVASKCWLLLTLAHHVTCDIESIPGDIYIEGMFSIFGHNVDGSCNDSQIDTLSVQHYEAVRWTIKNLNDDNYIPGVKIGLNAHVTCGSEAIALNKAYEIATELSTSRNTSVAIIGPETSAETEVTSKLFSDFPKAKRLLQIGYSATSPSLSDKTVYKNFFRVVPHDDVEIQVIKSFITKMKWTYVAIIHDNNHYGNHALDSLSNTTGVLYDEIVTCFPLKLSLDTTSEDTDKIEKIKTQLQVVHAGKKLLEGLIVVGNEDLSKVVLAALVELKGEHIDTFNIPVMLFSRDSVRTLGIDDTFLEVTKGMFAASPVFKSLDDFDEKWDGVLGKDWEKNFLNNFANILGCDSSLTSCPFDIQSFSHEPTTRSITTQYAIASAHVAADAIKHVHGNICSGGQLQNCINLLINEPKETFINSMSDLQVNFDNNQDLDGTTMSFSNEADATTTGPMSTFNIFNHQLCESGTTSFCFKKVFEYIWSSEQSSKIFDSIVDYNGGSSDFTNYPYIRYPQCPEEYKCPECPQKKLEEFDFEPGDMYVVAICPIHRESDTPLKCGAPKRGGFDVGESVKYMIKHAKGNMQNSVPNAKIGHIIIDSCNDPQIVLGRVLQLHNQGIYQNGKFIEVKSKILGYIGGWISDVSITVAETLSRLGYVQISYGSTSPVLSDRDRFPYFMRVVPSDVNQGDEMLKVVRDMGSNLVQILYSETAYGIGGKNSIVDNALKYGICVAKITGVPSTSKYNVAEIIGNLTVKNSAKVVMVFLSSIQVVDLIEQLNEKMADYTFVASEGWGNRYINPLYTNLVGSIVLANELPIDTSFVDYFKSLSPLAQESPWLQQYMEDVFDCSFEWSFDKESAKGNCNLNDTFVPCFTSDDNCFKIETWVPFASVAVEALLKGARITLNKLCGGDTSQVCDEFRQKPKELVNSIKPLKLAYDKVSNKEVFDDKNDGLISYNKYIVGLEGSTAVYKSVNKISETNTSMCNTIPNPACEECFNKQSFTIAPSPGKPVDHSQNAMYAFLGSTVLLAVALVAVVISWKRNTCLCKPKTGENDPYLHATYSDNTDYTDSIQTELRRGDGIPACSAPTRGQVTNNYVENMNTGTGSFDSIQEISEKDEKINVNV